MKVLVTGATGLIGGAVIEHLLARGDRVHALVRDPGAAARLAALGVTLHRGSILDPNAIAAAARGSDVLVHAAGIPSSRASAEVLRWTLVAGTENAIAAAKHAGVGRMVLVSSSDVTLANVDRVHWDEKRDLPHPPVGDRARALKLAEEIAITSSDHELEVTALRPGWVWGPGDRTLLPSLISEAREGGIRMFGAGTSLVATTYVETLAAAVVAAARAPKAAAQVYYVSDPDFLELREFLAMLSRALHLPPPRPGPPFAIAYPIAVLRGRAAPTPPEDILRRVRSAQFNVQKAISELDFRAEITVEQGMKRLTRWVSELGGVEALLRQARVPTTDEALAQERKAAGIA